MLLTVALKSIYRAFNCILCIFGIGLQSPSLKRDRGCDLLPITTQVQNFCHVLTTEQTPPTQKAWKPLKRVVSENVRISIRNWQKINGYKFQLSLQDSFDHVFASQIGCLSWLPTVGMVMLKSETGMRLFTRSSEQLPASRDTGRNLKGSRDWRGFENSASIDECLSVCDDMFCLALNWKMWYCCRKLFTLRILILCYNSIRSVYELTVLVLRPGYKQLRACPISCYSWP